MPSRRRFGQRQEGDVPEISLLPERLALSPWRQAMTVPFPTANRADGTDDAPRLLWLSDARAADPSLTGAKAANLAVARAADLPVIDGFVLTTIGTSELDGRPPRVPCAPGNQLFDAWRRLTDDGQRTLAVRSSSVAEDSSTSSMAGQFVSVLHVSGWHLFQDAVREVIASAAATEIADAPMAVLVQPMAEARLGGVLFGIDPLTGDRSHTLVSVVEGLPDLIVSGTATGTQVTLSRRGRVQAVVGADHSPLRSRHRRELARLARRTARLYGSPQDMEWLIEPDGTLRLLQSRPITAAALPPERSHLLGPGPVAETFPAPLSRLEQDLWEPPLEAGIREALRISGAVSHRTLSDRLLVDVDGRVAVDLEALGVVEIPHTVLHRLDPRPPARRLRAAWRIGRLRIAMPAIVHDLVSDVDRDLAEVHDLTDLGDRQLLTLLANAQQTLAALHAHEVLAGFFLGAEIAATTGASIALAEVAHDRADGLDDGEIVARHPAALALVPPRIGPAPELPPTPDRVSTPDGVDDDPMAVAREALRLRARWVHELMARAAWTLGERLTVRGQLRQVEDVRSLPLTAVERLVGSLDRAPAPESASHDGTAETPSLPARFRLAADGSVVPDLTTGGGESIGVSPGRVSGIVTHDPAEAAGKVLVVPTLDPGLAARLPVISALVAETGSPLSHLAILAREHRVPTVVNLAGAVSDLHDGEHVLVDGATGVVELLDRSEDAPTPDPASAEVLDAREPVEVDA